jgi:DNA mismatch repair protein MSH6
VFQILVQGGENGASPSLLALLRSLQTTSVQNFRVETIQPTESFPESTAIDPQVRQQLERGVRNGRVNKVQPWDWEETLAELHRRKYYPRASKKNEDHFSAKRWPKVLKAAVEGNAELALSSFGAVLYYLQRNLIDGEILSSKFDLILQLPNSSVDSTRKAQFYFPLTSLTSLVGIVKAYIPPESCAATEKGVREIQQIATEQSLNDAGLNQFVASGTDQESESAIDFSVAVESESDITHMSLDGTTLHNLEILTNAVDYKAAGSLWSKINYTKTPHGSRLLRAWLLRPLFRKLDIERRLDAVQELASGGPSVSLVDARDVLAKCGDIERLLSRVHSMSGRRTAEGDEDIERVHPNERAVLYEGATYTKRKVGDFAKVLNGLRCASQIPEIFSGVHVESGLLQKILQFTDQGGCFPRMAEELDWFFSNFDCDLAAKGLFEPSLWVDELFDEACATIERIVAELNDFREEMCSNVLSPRGQARSSWKYANTGPESKDKYMIELPASVKVPDDFIMTGKRGSGHKQVNKYRTPIVEQLVQELERAYDLQKERKSKGMELIFAAFDKHRAVWAAAAQATALLDALGALAQTASKTGYVRPTILDCPANESPRINIQQGRHPCVEHTQNLTEFIPNDLALGCPTNERDNAPRVLLLSGPNMGGKSTLLRQTCLITILAQVGSFVPAEVCELTPVDRIFTRLGAADRILVNQSTFFVELAETSAALRGATRRSLAIFDELGRGTSTFDGTAIASATVQHLVERNRCISLFATHYHSLLEEWKDNPDVLLGHMECMVADNDTANQDGNGSITFLYTLGEGVCSKSFGVNVARLAGLPEEVLEKAKAISNEFEEEMMAAASGHRSGRSFVQKKQEIGKSIEEGSWECVVGIWNELQRSSS